MEPTRKPARRFEDLLAWQKAHQFVLGAYRYAAGFPRSELYALTSQFRRAAVSIPANIAEGFKRRHKPDKIRFFNIAQSSLEEVRYYLILSRDLGYGDPTALQTQLDDASRLLERLTQSIENSMARQ
jgi:four helix bundle protein